MSLVSRALRNVARGRARTIGVAAIVGIALSLFLILSQINASITAGVDRVRSALKDVVTVQAAGSGFSLSTHITANIVPEIRNVSGVATVQRIVLDLPSFTSGGSGPPSNFTFYEGIDTTANITLFGGLVGSSSLSVTAGRMLDASDENSENAVVGAGFASSHSVGVGGTISVNGTAATVVGVFSTGASFTDSTVIVPYPFAKEAFAVGGPNLIYVLVSASASVNAVVNTLRSELGSGYDVEAAGEIGGGFGNALSSILSSTEFESIAALAVGGAVMVVTTALVMTRRTREIGLYKTFGFSNGKITRQLSLEGLLLAAFGLPIALVATVWLGPTVAQYVAGTGGGGGPGGMRFAGGFLGSISFSLTPYEVLLGAVVTVGFGLVGSLYPMLRALRLKPAEALRHD